MAIDLQKLLSGLDIRPTVPTGSEVSKGIGTVDASGESELKQGLNDIDNTLKPGNVEEYKLPENLGQSYLEYTPPADDELKKQAEASLAEYYLGNKENISKKAADSTKNLQDYLQNVSSAAAEKEQNIVSLFDDAKNTVAGEALKRGLARSSIVLNQMEGLAKQQVENIEKVRNGALDETAQIELQMAELKTEQDAALKNLDITYASKLAMQIADLTDKRDQKMFEVQKYNNQIAEKEQKYIIDKLKAEQDLKLGEYDLLKKEVDSATVLEDQLEQYRQKLKYEYIMDYLSGMSKADAIKRAETDSDIKDSLDTYYYRRLLNALEAR